MTLPTKPALRKELLAKRQALPAAERAAKSAAICRHAADWMRAQGLVKACLYLPIRGEPDVTGLRALVTGGRFALPVVAASGRGMKFHEWTENDALVKNRFGIEEPDPATAKEWVVGPDTVILVPSLAIDRDGVRLGYGGGFYDTYLSATSTQALGVVYSAFFLAKIPHEAHDQRLARVVTEDGVQT